MTPTELSLLAMLTAAAHLFNCPALQPRSPSPSLPLAQVQMSSTHSPLSDCLQQVKLYRRILLRASSRLSHLFTNLAHTHRDCLAAVAAAADQFTLPAASGKVCVGCYLPLLRIVCAAFAADFRAASGLLLQLLCAALAHTANGPPRMDSLALIIACVHDIFKKRLTYFISHNFALFLSV